MLPRRTLLIGILAFFLIGSMLPSWSIFTLTPIPKVHAVSHSVKLTGTSYSGWNGTNPGPTITVTQGDSVSMTLVSGDGAPHTFTIDVDKDGVIPNPNCAMDKCSPSFTTTTPYPFTVDFGPGTYTYYCSVHLNSMVGTFIVQDFTVSASPTSLTVNSGISGTSTITVAGSNGFSGTVSIAATAASGRATVTPSPTSVMLSSTTTSATSILTVSSALGTFNVTVTATSGATAHSTQVMVNGPDFTITTNSSTVSVNQGSSATLNVTLTSIHGFSGSVVLSALSSSGGPPVTVSPTSLPVPSSGSVSATLTVTASASGAYSTPVSTGSYTITLNATMGSLSHIKTIPLTVTSPSSGAGILTSPIVIGGIVAAIAVVAGIVYVLRRRPKMKT